MSAVHMARTYVVAGLKKSQYSNEVVQRALSHIKTSEKKKLGTGFRAGLCNHNR